MSVSTDTIPERKVVRLSDFAQSTLSARNYADKVQVTLATGDSNCLLTTYKELQDFVDAVHDELLDPEED